LTAMTLESATRVLKDFKDDGIIEMEGQKIEIISRNALEKISLHG